MADVRIDGSYETLGAFPTWDLHVKNGVCQILTGDQEAQQKANVSAFIQKGSVPQTPDVGINWTGFLTHELSFGELDAEIRQALFDADSTEFAPAYDIVEEKLYTNITKGGK